MVLASAMGSDSHPDPAKSVEPSLPGRPRPRSHVSSGGFPIPFDVTSRRGESQWACRPAAPGNSAAPPPPAAARPGAPRSPGRRASSPAFGPSLAPLARPVIVPADRAVRLPGLPSCSLRPELAFGLSVPYGPGHAESPRCQRVRARARGLG